MKQTPFSFMNRLVILFLLGLCIGPMTSSTFIKDLQADSRIISIEAGALLEKELKIATEKINTGKADVLKFGPGEFKIPGNLEFIRKFNQGGFKMTGAGPGITRLVFTNQKAAIHVQLDTDIHQAAQSPSFLINNMSILASGKCGTAILVGRHDKSVQGGTSAKQFKNLTIEGLQGRWIKGIVAEDISFCTFKDITIRISGKKSFGICITGNTAPVDHYISGVRVLGTETGIYVGGNVEGVYMDKLTIIGVTTGIDWNTISHEPLLALSGSHISAGSLCVRANNLMQSVIKGNLLYQKDPNIAWTGIQFITPKMTNFDLHQISHNTLHGHPKHTVENCGIAIEAASSAILNSNIFSHLETGIQLGNKAKEVTPTNSLFRNTKRSVMRDE